MIKVMVAEDENLIRKKLVYFPNYESLDMVVVKEVDNGVDGLEYIKKFKPDIVICDINMPQKNGLDMIKGSLDYDYIAIIVSGYNSFEYAQRALKYGVTDYILKPIDVKELEESLKSAKEILEQRRNLNNQANKKDISLNIGNQIVEDETVRSMIIYIQENYYNKISIRDLSKILMYSESMLNKKFKDSVGITFNEYLNRYRINKSIYYLQNSDYNITEISYNCGFSSPKYFARVFKKYMGLSPSEITK